MERVGCSIYSSISTILPSPRPVGGAGWGEAGGAGRGGGWGEGLVGSSSVLADPHLSLFLLSGQYSPGRVPPLVTVSCS